MPASAAIAIEESDETKRIMLLQDSVGKRRSFHQGLTSGTTMSRDGFRKRGTRLKAQSKPRTAFPGLWPGSCPADVMCAQDTRQAVRQFLELLEQSERVMQEKLLLNVINTAL